MADPNYYKRLGIHRNATQSDIKNAFHKMALKYHPDKNRSSRTSSAKKFQKVMAAYAILKDRRKRYVYDQECKHGFSVGQRFKYFTRSNNGNDADLMSEMRQEILNLVGNIKSRTDDMQEINDNTNKRTDDKEINTTAQVPPIYHDVYIELSDVLNGCVKRVEVSRQIIKEDGHVEIESKIWPIYIHPGSKAGTEISLNTQGDQTTAFYDNPANIVFLLRDKPHPWFTRVGDDLIYEIRSKSIVKNSKNLLEIPTLEGGKLRFAIEKGIDRNGYIKVIDGEGLPMANNPSKRGNLILKFV